jgi:hypothetical protein
MNEWKLVIEGDDWSELWITQDEDDLKFDVHEPMQP